MKRLSLLVCALCALTFTSLAGMTNTQVQVAWDWAFPTDLGGLSKADYATNLTWQLYSANSVTGIYSASLSLGPAAVQFDGNTNFTATIPATNRLAFFKLTVITAGGESDFSNVLPVLPAQSAGHLASAKGR